MVKQSKLLVVNGVIMIRKRRKSHGLLNLIIAFLCWIFEAIWKLLKIIVPILVSAVVWIFSVGLPAVVYFFWSICGYSKSEYREITGNSLLDTYTDKGKRGEYLLYRHLKNESDKTKWLFNLYIPREDGRTTEIDVLMIHPSGIYVFESKNYSGWIYGSSNREKWTQCIKPSDNAKAQKYHFLNPLIQNKIHVKYLSPLLPDDVQDKIFSVVVFGNRCKLKNIELDSSEQIVTHIKSVKKVCKDRFAHQTIDEATINSIFQELYQYTQISEDVKKKHINDINATKDNYSWTGE